MKQIRVVPHGNEYIVMLPADANGYLHPVYQTGQVFLGDVLNENWGVPDAELKHRIKYITEEEHKQIYRNIFETMQYVDKLFYQMFLDFVKFRLDIERQKSKTFIDIITEATTVNEARALLRKRRLDRYVTMLDAYLFEFEKEIGL